ncbi:amino acid permease-domain-containing protein [Apodospora peruviana]|uniref:Amino acid permease-domain-containing protein n=1 Tax=Apodospora peruviana TaxID=516989 RepID=A0AAE0I484_9PEZI|nr:amino acid permease-domain-containing protein [Apodospora peruviana]
MAVVVLENGTTISNADDLNRSAAASFSPVEVCAQFAIGITYGLLSLCMVFHYMRLLPNEARRRWPRTILNQEDNFCLARAIIPFLLCLFAFVFWPIILVWDFWARYHCLAAKTRSPETQLSTRINRVVRNAPETLKIAAPLANFTATLLYILANIGYFAASSKSEIANSGKTVAASFFANVFGEGVFITRVLPFIISLSILGNIFSQTFAAARVKQEVAKEGILPFSRLFASDWPIQTPTGGLLLHWIFTVALVVGPKTGDAYPFISLLSTYSQSWVKLLIACGLICLTLSPSSDWKNERTSFHTSNYLTIPWALSLLFVLSAPFIRNNTITSTIPWYVVPTVGCSILVIGSAYWVYWLKIWPLFGYSVKHEREVLPDGSERIKYTRVVGKASTGWKHNFQWY